jgi:hypothetical protein
MTDFTSASASVFPDSSQCVPSGGYPLSTLLCSQPLLPGAFTSEVTGTSLSKQVAGRGNLSPPRDPSLATNGCQLPLDVVSDVR